MPPLVPMSPCTAVAPSATITFGATSSSCSREVRHARRHLVGLGLAVLGRAALDDVADVDVVALEAHRGDHPVEQLPGLADERQALRVLVGARPSPMKQSSAAGLPRANTVCVRVAWSAHFVQARTSSASSTSRSFALAPFRLARRGAGARGGRELAQPRSDRAARASDAAPAQSRSRRRRPPSPSGSQLARTRGRVAIAPRSTCELSIVLARGTPA